MIRFWCECGRQLQASEKSIGQTAVCPLCERTAIVPATDQASRVAQPAGFAPLDRGRFAFDSGPAAALQDAPAAEGGRGSGLATAAVVLGVLSFPFMLSVLAGLPAIVVGILALCNRRVREGELGGKGKAIAGILLGGVGLLMIFPALLVWDRYSVVQREREEAARRAEKERAAKKRAASRVNMSQNVWLEVEEGRRRVLVASEVCLRQGQLEQLLTRRHAKEHEAILAADVDARKVHEALVLAGAKPGSTVRFDPEFRAPTGTTIRVYLQYEQDGETKTVPARSWIRSSKTKSELGCDWVFAGSHLIEDAFNPQGPKRYLANEGDVICVANFEGAMLDLPIESNKSDDDLNFEAWTERIPEIGTKVTIILEPVLK
jgi:hypothetical protein